MPASIDLNADIGEGFGPYTIGNDAGVCQFITSANIACGLHAGDPATMRRTVHLACERKIAIGAHPGLPDRLGFGRRNWDLSPQDAYDLVVYQIGALAGFAHAEGTRLRHVKPHGALYNMAAKDAQLAAAIAEAIVHVDPQLILFALARSHLVAAGKSAGLRVAQEAFADRTYEPDGSLTPRDQPGAVITDPEAAIRHALGIARDGLVTTRNAGTVSLPADTICVHGDHPDAAEVAGRLRHALESAGIGVRPPFAECDTATTIAESK